MLKRACSHPVRLVIEHCCEVSNDLQAQPFSIVSNEHEIPSAHVDDAKDQAILGAHGEIAATSITRDRVVFRGEYEKFMHSLR